MPVVKQALSEANLTINDIDGIAATNRPGLMGSLLVGLTFGKTLAWSTGKPFVAVNHMLGHLYAANLVLPGQDDLMKDVEYPLLTIRFLYGIFKKNSCNPFFHQFSSFCCYLVILFQSQF